MEFNMTPLTGDDIVLIGNSIIEMGGNWSERLGISNVRNRGISGDVTEGVMLRLGEIINAKPKAVFILIGINDLFNNGSTPDYVSGNILSIATSILSESPSTKVFVLTILPTIHEQIADKIRITNKQLKAFAVNGKFNIIDTHEWFADEKDYLKKELTTDGVHLTESGYMLFATKLKQHLRHLK